MKFRKGVLKVSEHQRASIKKDPSPGIIVELKRSSGESGGKLAEIFGAICLNITEKMRNKRGKRSVKGEMLKTDKKPRVALR